MNKKDYEKRMKWFQEARFGMFIHWGLYAIPARGEWIRMAEKMSNEQYYRYFNEFDPQAFDPDKWAALAKQAGMRYAVLTAKHHDGFCLFDSKLTDFKSTNTKLGRDIVREFLEAFRKQGLKVGLYYSLLDWNHPDYPHMTDSIHPMRGNPDYPDDKRDFNRYLDYMHGQVEELCTNYGKLDVLWFDFSYDEKRGEYWKASELMRMVRKYQPEVIVDNRLEVSGEGFGSLASAQPTTYSGDFVSPEQIIPPEGIRNLQGEPIPWEACITLNNHWGYCRYDHAYKSADLIIRKLVECVSKGGNLLLNVGPDANGRIPDGSVKTLQEVGGWMEKNSLSIYGCGYSGLDKPEYGRLTKRGHKLYLHVTEPVIGPLPLKGIKKEEIDRICLLYDGAELLLSNAWVTTDYKDDYIFIYYAQEEVFTVPLPDSRDTVIEITLKD